MSPLHGCHACEVDEPAGHHSWEAYPHDVLRQDRPEPLDRVSRQFKAAAPNRLWVSDFTYVATWQGLVYVAFMIDAFGRRIVGWLVSRTAHASFVLDALEQALHDSPRSCLRSRAPLRQGRPIVSIRYSELRAEAGIKPSVGSGGDSYHSALTETINGLYKAEVIYRRGPCRNSEAVKFATLKWVNWFNHRRLLEPIGNMPPAEAEVQYYARLDAPAMAAELERNGLWQTRSSSRQPVSHGLSS